MHPPLTARQIDELELLEVRPGLWRRVPPDKADADLWQLIQFKLVRWMPDRGGYELTPAGRAAIKEPHP